MPVRVKIDQSRCVVAHFCLFYAPAVFVTGDGGKPTVAREYAESPDVGVVPDEFYNQVREAELHCPSKAIKVYR